MTKVGKSKPRSGIRIGYRCLRCRTVRAVIRTGSLRPRNHVKTMFCAACKRPTAHIQLD